MARMSRGRRFAREAPTVVWPFGATLDRRRDGAWIVRLHDRTIGTIGGGFRLGGGEVDTLRPGMNVAASDIDRAVARCPGKFWLVGEVSRN